VCHVTLARGAGKALQAFNAGQCAIMVAQAYPDPAKLKRQMLEIPTSTIDKADLSRARAICKWAPEWVEAARGNGRSGLAIEIALRPPLAKLS
jgi:hypothetical protein